MINDFAVTQRTPGQSHHHLLTNTARLARCMIFILSASVHAEDTNPMAQAQSQKIDPSGTWAWAVPGRRNGPELTNALVLKIEGAGLTGQIVSPGRTGDTNILTLKDAKVNGDDISFVVSRKYDAFTMTANYSGKVDGDRITGKIAVERLGRSRTNSWTAIRQSHKTDMLPEQSEATVKK